jgi:hypothetical protein
MLQVIMNFFNDDIHEITADFTEMPERYGIRSKLHHIITRHVIVITLIILVFTKDGEWIAPLFLCVYMTQLHLQIVILFLSYI